MNRFLPMIAAILLAATSAQAQGLSEYFAAVRSQKRAGATESLEPYLELKKSLADEWPAINAALGDPEPLVRRQATGFLSLLVYMNMARPVTLPKATQELVLQRFREDDPGVRENAVRAIGLMTGGPPLSSQPTILQMARTDSARNVRQIAIAVLATVRPPSDEIEQFWLESLKDASNKELRGIVLNSFRLQGPTDPEVVSLVIEALKDPDRFVRQEAIAAIVSIGGPAMAAMPLLEAIRDSQSNDESLRANAAGAIRILNEKRLRE